MLISVAGRIAQAFIAETEGVYRPSWSIDDVAAEINAIRDKGKMLLAAAPKPWGFERFKNRSLSR